MKIYAAKGWQDTGYKPGAQRSVGSKVVIRATGKWHLWTGGGDHWERDANGQRPDSGIYAPIPAEGGCPYKGPGALSGQLIGRLGQNGEPFLVGSHLAISTAGVDPADSLWLTINDEFKNDNAGELDVTFEAGDFELRDPAAERDARIAAYEAATGEKYTP